MFEIRARGLAITDAEYVLAKMWRGLESNEIRTPRLVVEPVSDGIIDLRICFDSAKDAGLIRRVLQPMTARIRRKGADLRLLHIA